MNHFAHKIPQPFPYQGSKRNLSSAILDLFPRSVGRLIEPFAGSAAVTLAAAGMNRAKKFVINDFNKPLVELWKAIVESPEDLASNYARLWNAQQSDPRSFYNHTREVFNRTGDPAAFLYLLARCVKASVRYNSDGKFNQSPDNRRLGMIPITMRANIVATSALLRGRTSFTAIDYQKSALGAKITDVVYMDPPYQGVCTDRDKRYLKSVQFEEFVETLREMNARGISYMVSYDGRTGDKIHGRRLPEILDLRLIELEAGRSSQATLLGRVETTFESLYLSPALLGRIADPITRSTVSVEQLSLV